MPLYRRPLVLPDNLSEVLNLAAHSPLSLPHLADWPYRFASWALDEPENVQGWFDESARLLAGQAYKPRSGRSTVSSILKRPQNFTAR